MYLHRKLENKVNFFRKIKELDFILLLCILLLGLISLATMYSTDSGELLFHTKSHFFKFTIFTLMMLLISFLNIKEPVPQISVMKMTTMKSFCEWIRKDLTLSQDQN